MVMVVFAAALTTEVQSREHNVFGGAAKITLPKGATLQPFEFYEGVEGHVVYFSKKDDANRVYIQREKVAKSLSTSKWRGKVENYYKRLFKESGYKKNSLG